MMIASAVMVALIACALAYPAMAHADLQVGQSDQLSQAGQPSLDNQPHKPAKMKSIRKAIVEKVQPLAFTGGLRGPTQK